MWRRLVAALGDPDWADPGSETSLGTAAARRLREPEIDARIAEHTRTKPAAEWMHALQAVDVEAGVVQGFEELLHDPQLASREHFVRLSHSVLTVHGDRQTAGRSATSRK